MKGSLQPMHFADHLASLVNEQINRVAGMVPEQMIGPAARAAIGTDILPAEKIGLHVKLLDGYLTAADQPVNLVV